jgi:CheY-like chemotaxis protein
MCQRREYRTLVQYDLVILDVMLPARDGWSILAEMRCSGTTTPVLFLTARAAGPRALVPCWVRGSGREPVLHLPPRALPRPEQQPDARGISLGP